MDERVVSRQLRTYFAGLLLLAASGCGGPDTTLTPPMMTDASTGQPITSSLNPVIEIAVTWLSGEISLHASNASSTAFSVVIHRP